MNKYITSHPVTLGVGTVLGLTDAQAHARRHALKKIGTGRYEATAPVNFKSGEAIAVEGELPKNLGDVIVDEKEAAARAKSESQRAGKEAARLRKQIAGEVYAELLELLPQDLRAQVETLVADAAAKSGSGK